MSGETSIIYVNVQGRWGEIDYDDDDFDLIYLTNDNEKLNPNEKLSPVIIKDSVSTYQITKNTLSTN